MKKAVALIFVLLLLAPATVYASDERTLTDELLEHIDMVRLEGIMNESSFYELYGYTDPVTFVYDVVFNPQKVEDISLSDAVSGLVASETKEILSIIIQIFSVGVVAVFAGSVYGGVLSEQISSSVNMICVMSVATMLGSVFASAVNECASVVDTVSGMLGVCIPAMLMLTAVSGSVSASGIISPVLALFCSYAQIFINNVLLPVGVVIFVLGTVDCVSDSVSLKNFCAALKKTSTVILGLAFTIVSGIVSVEGITFSSVDSIGKKAVKYVAGSLIPVVGNFLSGSFDTMAGLVAVIKNAVGFLGVLIVFAVVISPWLRLALICLALKLTSAVVAIFAEGKVSECIDRAASALGFVLTLNTAIAVMSIVLISILMNMGVSLWG